MASGSPSKRRASQQVPGRDEAAEPPKKKQRVLFGRRGPCLDADDGNDGNDGDGELALTPARIDPQEIKFERASPGVKTSTAERKLGKTPGSHRGSRAHWAQPFDDSSSTVFNSTAGRQQIRALAAQDDPEYLAGFQAPSLTPDERSPMPLPPKCSSPRKKLTKLRRPTDPDSPWYMTEQQWEKELKAAGDGNSGARKRLERAHHCGRITEECGEIADPCDSCARHNLTCEVYKEGEGDGSQCAWCRWRKKACLHAKGHSAQMSPSTATAPEIGSVEVSRTEFDQVQAELRAVKEENARLTAKVDALDQGWSERFGRMDDTLQRLQRLMAPV